MRPTMKTATPADIRDAERSRRRARREAARRDRRESADHARERMLSRYVAETGRPNIGLGGLVF